jgi:GTP-binding protein HflX
VFVSAKTGEGIDELRARIAELLPNPDVELTVVVPYDRGDLVSLLHERGRIIDTAYEENGTRVHCFAPPEIATLVEQFTAPVGS